MSDSIYKIIELVGCSPNSWEEAAKNAVMQASKTLRDLRIAEVVAMDMHLNEGEVECYRTKVKISFKFES